MVDVDAFVHAGVPDDGVLRGSTVPYRFTPPARELTPDSSHGFAAIRFAEEFLGVELMPWQKWLLIHMLETRRDGGLRFNTIILEVPRQNGKTLLAVVLALFRMVLGQSKYVLGTAQNLETSEETWEDAIKFLEGCELAEKIAITRYGNGRRMLQLDNGAVWKVAPPSRSAGRSKSADLVVFDELREHRNWEAWGAISSTTVAMNDSLILGISNAGDVTSVVLRDQHDVGLKTVSEPSPDDDLGFYWWTAPKDAPIDSEETWARANPAYGYRINAERMRRQARQPESTFRTENLCQWVTADVETYINVEEWKQLADPRSQVAADSQLVLGVDVSADRQHTSVAVAGWRTDDVAHVEVIACRAGMLWVTDFIEAVLAKHDVSHVMVQARGCPASELIEFFERAMLPVRLVQGSMLGAATGQFRDRVSEGLIRHRQQAALDVAVSGAVTKKLGESVAWSRQSSDAVDIAPLVACSWALYGLAHPEETDQRLSAYANMGDWWKPSSFNPTDSNKTTSPNGDSGSFDWWK